MRILVKIGLRDDKAMWQCKARAIGARRSTAVINRLDSLATHEKAPRIPREPNAPEARRAGVSRRPCRRPAHETGRGSRLHSRRQAGTEVPRVRHIYDVRGAD